MLRLRMGDGVSDELPWFPADMTEDEATAHLSDRVRAAMDDERERCEALSRFARQKGESLRMELWAVIQYTQEAEGRVVELHQRQSELIAAIKAGDITRDLDNAVGSLRRFGAITPFRRNRPTADDEGES